MPLAAAALWSLLVTAAGMYPARRLHAPAGVRLVAAWLIGAAMVAPVVTGLALLHLLYPAALALVALAAGAAGFMARRELWAGLRAAAGFLRRYMGGPRSGWLFAGALLLLAWLAFLAWCPPRAADAMRYHLAQAADLAANHGLLLRPYYHYNFPLYFTMLAFPVFELARGVGMQMMVLISFVIAALCGLRLAARVELDRPWLLLFWLVLTPICFHEAHEAVNDWPLLAFALAGLVMLTEPGLSPRAGCLLGFVGLGLALGTKYQAVLLFPWFVLLGWRRGGLRGLVPALGLMLLVACPFYLRNWVNLGDPVWPLLAGHLPSGNHVLDAVATFYSSAFAGNASLGSFLTGFRDLLIYPLIPASLWGLAVWGLVAAGGGRLMLGWGMGLFLGLWLLVQPQIYPRFAIFILPAAMLAAVRLPSALGSLRARRLALGLIALTMLCGAAAGVWYTVDYARYAVTGDLDAFHRHTWFWPHYQWVNRRLPRDARLLVIVSSGHTYHLERDYLRADPDLSGLIDWAALKDLSGLRAKLAELKVDHVLYDMRDWSKAPGGREMMDLLSRLSRASWARRLWTRPARLCESRLRREYSDTNLRLLRVSPGGEGG